MSLGVLGWIVFVLCIELAVVILGHLPFWLAAAAYAVRRDPYARVEGFTPPVTIVKPVRGLAPDDEKNFLSFFAIDYPVFEILFVVHENAGDDPSIPVIERMIAGHPGVDARLIRSREHVAVHEKANNYIEGIAHAKYDTINITDADAFVEPDHLLREVRPLSDPHVSIVFSIQTMNHFRSAASAFEGLYQNGDYPVVLMLLSQLGLLRFVVGHTLVLRKMDFYDFGAIDVIKDHVSDDNAWGEVMHRPGAHIWMSRRITHTRYVKTTWRKAAGHILRWGMFWYKFSRAYVLVPLLQNSGLAVITLLLSLFLDPTLRVFVAGGTLPLRTAALVLGVGALVVRTLSIVLSNILYGHAWKDLRYAWTIPLRDIFTLFAAPASAFVRKFEHAGHLYAIRGKRMVRVPDREKRIRNPRA